MGVRLQFGPAGDVKGFNPAGIAAFDDLRPAAVVRELVQNSFDAAREAGQDTAVVRFRLSTVATEDIPDIEAYEKAFDAAITMQEEMGSGSRSPTASSVVRTIDHALRQDTQSVLSVFDNGIGIDERRMNALLADGVSAKGAGASGTYGNGHSVAIPASDLRYLLYAGALGTGEIIGSGHAVIASHAPQDMSSTHVCSGDGFLIERFRNGRNGKLFDCARGADIPKIIRDQLDELLTATDHGSVVIIPSFNNFRESRSLWDMVSEAVACNFFQAVADRQLVVHVEDPLDAIDLGSGIRTLDHSNIGGVLADNRHKSRSRAFLSGKKAYDSYNAFTRGVDHFPVVTSYGSLRIRLLQKQSGSPRIDLLRNGMWITDDKAPKGGIPGFYYKFRDRRPFHALLLLDDDKTELYRLVRDAEGPLHDKLNVKNLSKEDRASIKEAFGELRNWLLANTDEVSDTAFTPDDFLALDFGDGSDSWATPVAVGQRSPERNPVRSRHGRSRDGKPSNSKVDPSGRGRRRSVASLFSAVTVPVSVNRRRIEVTCHRECRFAELRLTVDENIDSTCDRVVRDTRADVELSDVLVDDTTVGSSGLLMENGKAVGVQLGSLAKGQTVRVEASYSLPVYFDAVQASSACLLVEVVPGADRGEGR